MREDYAKWTCCGYSYDYDESYCYECGRDSLGNRPGDDDPLFELDDTERALVEALTAETKRINGAHMVAMAEQELARYLALPTLRHVLPQAAE